MQVPVPDLVPVYESVERYYTGKVLAHGPTPLGVDWSCVPTQQLRFVQLLKLCDVSTSFSLNDLGCGYGALLAFMDQRFPGLLIDYLGVDLSAAMIEQGRAQFARHSRAKFLVGDKAPRVADYSVASGIFNVKLSQPEKVWRAFVQTTLDGMAATSSRGFAVNFLMPLESGISGAPELYRPEIALWQRYCENRYGATVTTMKNYGMREYTLLVRTGA